MKSKLKLGVLGLVVALGMIFGLAAPAQAAPWWGCPAGVGCVYTGYNGNSSMVVLSVGQYGVNICHRFDSPFVNSVSSVTETYGSDLDILIDTTSTTCGGAIRDTFFSGECAGTGGAGDCNGNDDGAWNFNAISTLRFDNRSKSFIIRDWRN